MIPAIVEITVVMALAVLIVAMAHKATKCRLKG